MRTAPTCHRPRRETHPPPPPGRYTLVIDGPLLDKPVRREIEIGAKNELLQTSLAVRAAPQRVRHTRKDGEAYSEKSGGY